MVSGEIVIETKRWWRLYALNPSDSFSKPSVVEISGFYATFIITRKNKTADSQGCQNYLWSADMTFKDQLLMKSLFWENLKI